MRMSVLVPLVVAVLFTLLGSVFIVREGHTAIVLNLGKVVRSDLGPGLHFKVPLVESVRIFDGRFQVLPGQPALVLIPIREAIQIPSMVPPPQRAPAARGTTGHTQGQHRVQLRHHAGQPVPSKQ